MSDSLQIGRQVVRLGSSPASSPARATTGESSVDTVELCSRRLFGTTDDTNYIYSLVGPVLVDVGPNIQEIVAHWKGESFGSGFTFQIAAEWSFDGEQWEAFTGALASGITSPTPDISSPYTTRTDFGRYIRFKIGVKHVTASTTGTLSVFVALRRFT